MNTFYTVTSESDKNSTQYTENTTQCAEPQRIPDIHREGVKLKGGEGDYLWFKSSVPHI